MPKSRQHKEFAERLDEAMTRQGWTGWGRAERLAEALRQEGLEKATSQLVSTWLRGDRMPRSPYADRLPKVLGLPAGYLSGAGVPEFMRQRGDSYSGESHAGRALSGDATEIAPALEGTKLQPDQEETAAMAANALRRALRLVQANLHGKRDREIMAEELERFADQLRERLDFGDVAADLYKAALNLRRQRS